MSNPYAAPQQATEPEHVEPHHPVAGPPPEAPPIPEGEEFVSVYSAGSVLEAEMITQFLQAEGISTPGFSRLTGAQVGAGMLPDEHLIRVPASMREQARELIDAYLEGDANALPPEAGEAEPLEQRAHRPFVKLVAWALLAPTLLALALAALTYVVWFFRSP